MTDQLTVRDVSTQLGGAAKQKKEPLEGVCVQKERTVEQMYEESAQPEAKLTSKRGTRKMARNPVEHKRGGECDSEDQVDGPRSEATDNASEASVRNTRHPRKRLQAVMEPFNHVETEIKITREGNFLKTISYGIGLFQREGKTAVVIRGLGSAIRKAVDSANAIYRKVPNLEMDTKIGSALSTRDDENGERTVRISFICILLEKIQHPQSRRSSSETQEVESDANKENGPKSTNVNGSGGRRRSGGGHGHRRGNTSGRRRGHNGGQKPRGADNE